MSNARVGHPRPYVAHSDFVMVELWSRHKHCTTVRVWRNECLTMLAILVTHLAPGTHVSVYANDTGYADEWRHVCT